MGAALTLAFNYAFLKATVSLSPLGLLRNDSPKPEDPLVDDKPASYAERGATVPIKVGRHMGGPLIAWTGNRYKVQVDVPSGGGGGKGQGGTPSDTKQDVWFEQGYHVLAVGPGFRLLRIWEDGKVLWPAPGQYTSGITWDSTGTKRLSGTSLVCNDENQDGGRSSFRIFWGEHDQPTNDIVGAATGLGSRWPFMFGVVWDSKRLGGYPNWSSLEYEFEIRPYRAGQTHAAALAGTEWDDLPTNFGTAPQVGSGWLDNGYSVDEGSVYPVVAAIGTSVVLCDSHAAEFPPGSKLRLLDGSLPFLDTTVLASANVGTLARVFETARHGRRVYPGLSFSNQNLINCTLTTTNNPLEDSPPGTVIGSGYLKATLTRTSASGSTSVMTHDIDASLAGYDPDGPGGKNDFGQGRNYITIYVKPSELSGIVSGELIQLGFTDDLADTSIKHYSRFNYNDGTGELVHNSDVNGAVGSVELTDGWYRLQVYYDTGEGVTPSSETDTLHLSIGFGSNLDFGDSITFVFGTSAGLAVADYTLFAPIRSYAEFIEWTTCSTVTSIAVATDTGLDLFDEPIPFQAAPLTTGELGPQGANGAHLLYQLLFETYPHGLGLTTDQIDLPSLQAVALALGASGEGLRTHMDLRDGMEFSSAVDAILVDLGLVFTWAVDIGKYVFKLLRDGDTPIVLQSELHASEDPELNRLLEGAYVPKVVFGFLNWEMRYREDDVVVPDHGLLQHYKTQARERLRLTVPRDFEAAAAIAERRAVEKLSPPVPFNFQASREAALLRPGDLVDVSDASFANGTPPLVENPVRVMAVSLDPASGKAKIDTMVDSYAVAPPTSLATVYDGGSSSGGMAVSASSFIQTRDPDFVDFAQRVFELPGFFGVSIGMLYLRIANSKAQTGAALLLSYDGTTYQSSSDPVLSVPGGVLLGALGAEYVETGLSDPNDTLAHGRVVEYGPLFYSPTDLPSSFEPLDEANWLSGKLVLLVDEELMVIREVAPAGGTVYQARGVVRGAFGTQQANHEDGAVAYLLQGSQLVPGRDPLLGKGIESYAKMLVRADSSLQDASTATAIPFTPTGKSLRAFNPLNLRNDQANFAFRAGEDVPLRWEYRLHSGRVRRTGAGFQGYGEAVNLDAELQGSFTVVILDASGTIVKRTVPGLTSPSYTYSSADRVADFGAESTFRVDVQFLGVDASASGRASKTFELL